MTSEVKITGSDRESQIRLTVMEVIRERYPSVRMSVAVQDGDFSAKVNAWVGRDELFNFLCAVEACERTRTGSAQLVSMSPDEFELRFEQCDGAGHFAARYEVSTYKCVRQGGVRQSLAGEFDLDSERFGDLVRDLREFIQHALPEYQKHREPSGN